MLLQIHQESASQASIQSQQEEREMDVYYKSVIIQDAPVLYHFS